MQKKFRYIWALPVVAFLATGWVSGTAEAGVTFDMYSTITPGTGYTTDVNDENQLMNVTFTPLTAAIFSLGNPGDPSSVLLTLATVRFLEPNGDPADGGDDGISQTEASGDLSVALTVHFNSPATGDEAITVNVTVNAGQTGYGGNGELDLVIPAQSFSISANGGSYTLNVISPTAAHPDDPQTLTFKNGNYVPVNDPDGHPNEFPNPAYIMGTMSYVGPSITPVPEPASLLVWSLVAGIFGVGGLRRRRNRAAA